MCLLANKEKRLHHDASPYTRAWKVVNLDRTPYYRSGVDYQDGAEIFVNTDFIKESRCGNIYNFGLHVYTDAYRAQRTHIMALSRRWATLIEVEVDPADWIAEDTDQCEAVYSKLKVIGEVRP